MSSRCRVGLELIETLVADDETKQRLKLVLGTLTGLVSVPDACRALGLKRTRFYELRDEAIHAALSALAPKPAGRRRAMEASPPGGEFERVKSERDELAQENYRLRVQQDLLLAWPNALSRMSDPPGPEKRGSGRKRTRPPNGSGPTP